MMLRVTQAFVDKLATKADRQDTLSEGVHVYYFDIHIHKFRVKIIEDDSELFAFLDPMWVKFIQMYVGARAEHFTFSTVYQYPLDGTDKEMAEQYLAIKALTNHDDRVWEWMDLKPYQAGYYNYNGKQYFYYLNGKLREHCELV